MMDLVMLKWYVIHSPELLKLIRGCTEVVLMAVIVRPIILAFSKSTLYSFNCLCGWQQSYNTSATTCCVMPHFFGRPFYGGFEGAIGFNLAAK